MFWLVIHLFNNRDVFNPEIPLQAVIKKRKKKKCDKRFKEGGGGGWGGW